MNRVLPHMVVAVDLDHVHYQREQGCLRALPLIDTQDAPCIQAVSLHDTYKHTMLHCFLSNKTSADLSKVHLAHAAGVGAFHFISPSKSGDLLICQYPAYLQKQAGWQLQRLESIKTHTANLDCNL